MLPWRFWNKVNQDGPLWEGGSRCWLWTGYTHRRGYGWSRREGKKMAAHRMTYEDVHGPIPEGLTLDHLCRVRNCVNPRHLEAVTNRENILRGQSGSAINARKTHCVRGHAFTESNTLRRPNGFRDCRACKQSWNAARYSAGVKVDPKEGANAH